MLYNIHWRHDRLTNSFTRMKTWQEVGEQIFMYTGGAAETTLTWSTVRLFFPTGRRQMLYGWYYYTVYIFHHHLPIWNLYTTKWEYWFKGEAPLYLTVFFNLLPSFLICLPFITFSPQPEINWDQSSVFFPTLADPRFGVFWTWKNTFPSVREICSSNRCIRDESFCSLPKPKSQLTYHSNSHP